jgi:hypothetical protein
MPTDRRTAARLVAIVCATQVFVQLGAGYWPVLLPELMGRWSLSNSEAGWITSAFFLQAVVSRTYSLAKRPASQRLSTVASKLGLATERLGSRRPLLFLLIRRVTVSPYPQA